MRFLDKLLATEVQTKQLSDVDVKKIRKQMAKKGYHLSEDDIRNRIQEYQEAYELRNVTKAKNKAFIVSIIVLIILAIQEELFKSGLIQMTSIDRVLTPIAGMLVVAAAWLCCLFKIKKQPKYIIITMLSCLLLEIITVVVMMLQ